MCRALQKERSDLSNQVSLLQEQGEEGTSAAATAQQQDPSAMDEEDDDDEEQEEDSGNWVQSEELETAGVHEAVRQPETESLLAADDKTTTSSQTAEAPATLQD